MIKTKVSISKESVELFSHASRDINPLHMSDEYARRSPFGERIVHGVLGLLYCLSECKPSQYRAFAKINVEFLHPIFMDKEYTVEVKYNSDSTYIQLCDGHQVLLSAEIELSDEIHTENQYISNEQIHNMRTEAADWKENELVPGICIKGNYEPDWNALHTLDKMLGLSISGINTSVMTNLLCSSYLVGMEFPGRRALFSKLTLNLLCANEKPIGALSLETTLQSFLPEFGLMRFETSAYNDSQKVSSMEFQAFIRKELSSFNLDAIANSLPKSNKLSNKVALVTGGSRGLGAALVLTLARQGATVYLNYRNSHGSAKMVKEAAESLGGKVILLQGDSSDESWCQNAREKVKSESGRLDMLCCNAWPSLNSLWIDDNRSFEIANYIKNGVDLVNTPISYFTEMLSETHGRVVAISTTAVEDPVLNWPHYVSAKAAVEGLVKVAAMQYPEIGFLIARPSKLLTDLTNTPFGNHDAMLPEVVATAIVCRLMDLPTLGKAEVLEKFELENLKQEGYLQGENISVPKRLHNIESLENENIQAFDKKEEELPKKELVIASTFTAEPLSDIFSFWDTKLKLGFKPVYAPYNQVIQQLLDPASLYYQNTHGINILLFRFEDWCRYGERDDRGSSLPPIEEFDQLIRKNTRELIEAISTYKQRSNTPMLVCVCPESPDLFTNKSYMKITKQAEKSLKEDIGMLSGIYFTCAADHSARYKVKDYYDARRDELGHIPYTSNYYITLGTIIKRKIYGIVSKPYKVIVLDCDNTLWSGVCGEDGPIGIKVNSAYKYLQQLLVKQQEQGMLLCLCSKNVEEDVMEVFKQRTDLPLQLEHITAHRINWMNKSENICSLAHDLNLGLDSFIFIDDNPVEIAEVQAGCPQVLALQLPKSEEDFKNFFDHIWPFDKIEVTQEDRNRTKLYQEQRKRESFKSSFTSIQKFIEGLELKTKVEIATKELLPRVSQLTQRTNQFNFTTKRRNEAEIQQLMNEQGWSIFTSHVSDRFGDYGLVGVVMTRQEVEVLVIDTFLLSCRVLGRRVEHELLNYIGKTAREAGIEKIRIDYIQTPKNKPALNFLESIPFFERKESKGQISYFISAEDAENFKFLGEYNDEFGAEKDKNLAEKVEGNIEDYVSQNEILEKIARYYGSIDSIEKEMFDAFENPKELRESITGRQSANIEGRIVNQQENVDLIEPIIKYLQEIFSQTLRVNKESLHPKTHFNTFRLTSLKSVDLTVRLEKDLGELPRTLLFEHTTLESLAQYLIEDHEEALIRYLNIDLSDVKKKSKESENKFENLLTSSIAEDDGKKRGINDNEGIAIVGLAGRYPQAQNIDEYWDNLVAGKESIDEIPKERWDYQTFYDPQGKSRNKGYSKWGAFIEDYNCFDSLFFNISPREAELMDPQQRIFLEMSYKAIEDAGYTRETIGKNVGVYAGVMAHDYQFYNTQGAFDGNSSYPYSDLYQVPNRVSYFFDFSGPSIAIDTACSSSGVALHLACEAIQSGQCQSAIAGGVNLIMTPTRHIQYSKMGMLSRDGKCRAFGEGAEGFVMGEGAGAVLLKPLSQAIRDNDLIYGVIRGTAVNSGGRTSGFTVPNPNAQAELITSALNQAKIDSRTISYIETHGTGTELGDPIEIRGLTKAFQKDTSDKQFCALGSLKPNIGHLEAAAGIAGLTKILLQMRHRKLLPSINAETTNSNISFESTPFYLQKSLEDWERPTIIHHGEKIKAPRRAGLSSFGAGGVNAHLVLEEFVEDRSSSNDSEEPNIILFSARDKKQLRKKIEDFAVYLKNSTELPSLKNIAFTLQVGRESMDVRLAFIVKSLDELDTKLEHYLHHEKDSDFISGNVKENRSVSEILRDEEETRIYLNALLAKGKLKQVALLWAQGVDIPWKFLYADETPQRVSLPTYRFARISHWIPKASPVNILNNPMGNIEDGNETLHPFRLKKLQSEKGRAYKTELEGFYLSDHVVGNQKVFPGVAYLELAIEAAEQSQSHCKVRKLTNFVWIQPIIAKTEPCEINIIVKDEQEEAGIIISTDDMKKKLIHAQAQVEYLRQESNKRPPKVDVESIRLRCTKVHGRKELYDSFRESGFQYGHSFQVIQEHRSGENEAISLLKIPDSSQAEESWRLYPPIMDGAFQTVIAHKLGGQKFLPFALKELIVWEATPEHCYAHVIYHEKKNGVLHCSIKLLDLDGNIIVEFRELSLRATKPGHEIEKPASAVYYEPILKRQDNTMALLKNVNHVLLLDYEVDRFHMVRQQFPDKNIYLARQASVFSRDQEYQFNIDFLDTGHIKELIETISPVRSLVVLDFRGLYNINENYELHVSSVVEFTKTFLTDFPALDISMISLYEKNSLAVSALAGFARSVTKESSNIHHRIVQVNGQQNEVAKMAISEIGESATEVVYDEQGRWVRTFQPASQRDKTEEIKLRAKGVYLITGGTGGLGIMFAKYLAEKYEAKLILLGRSEPSQRIQEDIEKLKAYGAEVLLLKTDITKREELEWAVKEAKMTFGEFNGVIHAAGVIEDAHLNKKGQASFSRVLAPKVRGTMLLDEITQHEQLDFFILFSSIGSVIGNAGQTDYATANAFLDAFAEKRMNMVHDGIRNGRTISINWPLWKEGGMQVAPEHQRLTETTTGLTVLDTNEGIQVFEEILKLKSCQIVVAVGNKDTFEGVLQRATIGEPTPSRLFNGVSSKSESVKMAKLTERELEEKLIEELVKRVSSLLKVSVLDIDPQDDMSDYGFDSIAVTELANQLNEHFMLMLTPVFFFNNRTLQELACSLISEYYEEISRKFLSHVKHEQGANETSSQQETKTDSSKAESVKMAKLTEKELEEKLIEDLVKRVSSLLKVSVLDIDPQDDMSDYGFDSIAVTELANQLNEHFMLMLTPVFFFNNRTLQELACSLISEYYEEISRKFVCHMNGDKPVNRLSIHRNLSTELIENHEGLDTYYEEAVTNSGPSDKNVSNKTQDSAKDNSEEDIAIIGMSGRFPGSQDLNEFWENVKRGADLISEIPSERWDWEKYAGNGKDEENRSYSKWGGFIDNLDAFDASFFNISPREAKLMDPQQRLFLESAWHAIEDAGYSPKSLDNSMTGVFAGVTLHDYYELMRENNVSPEAHGATGNVHSIVPNRISYLLNLKGPSEPIDTACSSSLVAIHRAILALRAKDCEVAIAGGVNALLSPSMYIAFSHAGMLSKDGKCKTFDHRADGYVRGEGVGTIILKPLSRAKADGDTIYGVIRGSAVNHGGHANSLTAPNSNAQAEVIIKAFERAKFSPETVNYIEAHGTGTELGDPIEIEGLKLAFNRLGFSSSESGANFCGLGTVKTNIGHLESAAGMAGILKVLLAMKHKEIPPITNFEKINPYIQLENSPFYVVENLQSWERLKDKSGKALPLRAGVSSFGFGGVNAHVLLEEYIPETTGGNGAREESQIITLSAKNNERLKEYAEKLQNYLSSLPKEKIPALEDIAYTLQVGRSSMRARLAIIVSSVQELVQQLRKYTESPKERSNVFVGELSNKKKKVITDAGGPQYVSLLIEERKLNKLAALWVDGTDIDWMLLHQAEKCHRISLPGYPFAREIHWLPKESYALKKLDESKVLQTEYKSKLSTTMNMHLYQKDWISDQLPQIQKNSLKGKRWIVIVNDKGIIDLEKELKAFTDVDWIVLRERSVYPRIFSPSYEIDFLDGNQGKVIAEEIIREHGRVDGIIDLADIYGEQKLAEEIAWGRITFLQTMLKTQRQIGMSLYHFTTRLVPYENAVPTMSGALMSGLVKVIGEENAKLDVRTIDLDFDNEHSFDVLNIVASEYGYTTEFSELCYRSGVRYRPKLKDVPFKKSTNESCFGAYKVSPNYTYVITGGTGGLGSLVAQALVLKGARKLAITGVSPIPDREKWKGILDSTEYNEKIKKRLKMILELEDQGVEVLLFTGHLTERDRLSAFLARVRSEMGAIGGIIHCAGFVSYENPSIVHKNLEQIEAVLEPKVTGLHTLFELVKIDSPHFFVLFSSISAAVPKLGAGIGDYSMANAYLDSFATTHSIASGIPIFSIQWPSWKEGGMREVTNQLYSELGFTTLTSEEGLILLNAALSSKEQCLLPVIADSDKFNLDKLLINRSSEKTEENITSVFQFEEDRSISVPNKEETVEKEEEIIKRTKRMLSEIFAEELMFELSHIDGETTFDELGVDSILMAQLINKLEKMVEETLEPSIILEYPTLNKLSLYLARKCQAIFSRYTDPKTKSVENEKLPIQEPDYQESSLKKEKANTSSSSKIAIVGMACRFPGAQNTKEFWGNLLDGKSSIIEVPSSRWDINKLGSLRPKLGKSYGKWGGFINEIEYFDAAYFNIPESDAPHVDPLARLMLECSAQALANAGYQKDELWGRRVGVYVGSGTSNYGERIKVPNKGTVTGTNQNFIGAHLSHFYNWNGPNLLLDTACSSSLVAVHMACQALAAGECEMALVGGADLLLDETPYLRLSAAKALSPDGKCHTFDKKANGLVPGEGCGVVILKPLHEALGDGDRIYGVIEGSAINNDGHTMGITTPNLEAQEEVITEALARAKVNPASISMVEAHGTGTMIGDPIELRGLTNVYRRFTKEKQFCAVGSVKSNIGHLLLASGMASFIKTVLALHNKTIPATLNCEEPNPRFDFASSPFFSALETKSWERHHGSRRAGVSAFGFGGTNCHMILCDLQSVYFEEYNPSRSMLPPLVFDRKRYWIDQTENLTSREIDKKNTHTGMLQLREV
ncbi:SDR family NAD(P)-dependent oxidoreductase [Bacillus atrophaeus]|uniref:SDR family NAD(P)-dependent oxidoreductase n=1 Tax=Bacillus atrophaeus TaxID=1452 RepID=UPI0028F728CE|nr:SDR family NAD(P)-dependent oxidoreductase [Bacillus atrophaeus]WNV78054.1 SDR family NAD(P)-dependent oxidoreductase [Bacillus atrophaeus]